MIWMKIWMGLGLNSKTSFFTDVNHATSSFALFCSSSSCLVSYYTNITFSRCCSETTHGLNVRPLTTICLIHPWVSVVCIRLTCSRKENSLSISDGNNATWDWKSYFTPVFNMQKWSWNNRKAEPLWPLYRQTQYCQSADMMQSSQAFRGHFRRWDKSLSALCTFVWEPLVKCSNWTGCQICLETP